MPSVSAMKPNIAKYILLWNPLLPGILKIKTGEPEFPLL